MQFVIKFSDYREGMNFVYGTVEDSWKDLLFQLIQRIQNTDSEQIFYPQVSMDFLML
jgi:hypothetical protein